MMDVNHFPIFIDHKKLPEDAAKIICFVKPNWNSENIKFKIFTDGITNKLIGCYQNDEPENIILVRVYGDNTNLYIDRAKEVENFKLMNKNGYAPKLYATFDNGMVYEFIHGDVLDIHLCQKITVYPLVARMLAKMHKLRYDENRPLVPSVWDKCKCFINLISDTYSSSDKQLRYNTYFPGGKNSLQADLKQLKDSLENVSNVIVFCHNDLLLANVVYTGNSVWFIDYEYAGYNYQPFDIANHFAEFAGVTEYDSSLYPTEQFRMDWIRIYLQEFYGNENFVNEELVKKLSNEVDKFLPLAHFFWTIWSLLQAQHSSIDFDYLKYGVNRYNEFKKLV